MASDLEHTMVNTPPPPNPAPGGDATTNVQADALKGSEDVSSILANLSAEQLASIMDAAVSILVLPFGV